MQSAAQRFRTSVASTGTTIARPVAAGSSVVAISLGLLQKHTGLTNSLHQQCSVRKEEGKARDTGASGVAQARATIRADDMQINCE
jgi:hypothetical protein